MPSLPQALVLVLALLPALARAEDPVTLPEPNPRLEWAGPASEQHRVAASVLRAARRQDASGDELLRRLVAPREAGVPVLLDILEQARLPRAVPQDPPQLLNPAQSRLLLSALAALPRAAVRTELEARLAADPARESLRIAALELLAEIGAARDLAHLAELAPHVDGELARPARTALRGAYAAILRRTPECLARAGDLVRSQDMPAARELLLAAGEVGDARALPLLELCARSYPAIAQLAVSIVPEVGRSGDAELDRSFSGWLAASLDQQRPEWTRVALRALGALDDGSSVGTLIGALELAERDLAASALEALKRISGLEFGPDPAPWRAWFAAEQAWWNGERPRAQRALASGDSSAVLQALASYGQRRLFRDELSADVLAVLGRRESGLQRLACETLERLGSRRALEPLVELFSHRDARLADAAWKAACAISGRTLPRDAAESRALLAGA